MPPTFEDLQICAETIGRVRFEGGTQGTTIELGGLLGKTVPTHARHYSAADMQRVLINATQFSLGVNFNLCIYWQHRSGALRCSQVFTTNLLFHIICRMFTDIPRLGGVAEGTSLSC